MRGVTANTRDGPAGGFPSNRFIDSSIHNTLHRYLMKIFGRCIVIQWRMMEGSAVMPVNAGNANKGWCHAEDKAWKSIIVIPSFRFHFLGETDARYPAEATRCTKKKRKWVQIRSRYICFLSIQIKAYLSYLIFESPRLTD